MIIVRDMVLWLSVGAVIALGIAVYWTNPKRTVNRHFVTTTGFITGWMMCLVIGFRAETAEAGAFWIRQASAIGSCIIMGFNMLRLSIIHPDDSWWDVVKRMRWWWLLHLPVLWLCQTEFFLIDATLPAFPPGAVAEPNYGPGFSLYATYTMGSLLIVWGLFFRDTWRSDGMAKAELQYILLACFSFLLFGGLMTIFLPWITGESQTVRLSFINAIILEAIIAYGIAKGRILSMTSLLRSAIAYVLLVGYLFTLYLVVWLVADLLLTVFALPADFPAHLLAALVVAFSLAPAQGTLQRFARGLFISLQPLDTEQTLQRVQNCMRAVTTVSKFSQEFLSILRDVAGTDRLLILTRQNEHFAVPPEVDVETPPIRLELDDPLVTHLQQATILSRDSLMRDRQTPDAIHLYKRMTDLKVEILAPLCVRGRVEGIVCLGRRLSGRFYSSAEQRTLELLCSQAEVALENAIYFSEAQDSRIHNEVLLDSLPSGVIAVEQNGMINMINREAAVLLQSSTRAYLYHPYTTLPEPLPAYVQAVLEDGHSQRNLNLELDLGEQAPIPIRLSHSPFHSHKGDRLGALLVIEDLTAIRQLQKQLHHNDRLASIGRLSAGMAHEIKNPLVTIKTFTQLLPEQFDDEDFRHTFSSLVGGEIERIDRIVSQLLQFSRPSPPTFSDVRLHHLLDNACEFVKYEISKQRMTLETELAADDDRINADGELLRQAFVNLILNALEAMEPGGRLTIRVRSCTTDELPPGCESGGHHGWLHVEFEDTGCGMPQEQVNLVFEPFYTTKSTGTGLGLSVVHGIIKDHHGWIHVTSQPDHGTTFHVYLPRHAKERP